MTGIAPSLGILEFSSIAAGIDCTDQMLKSADVSTLFSKTICPGKYVTGVHGDVAAVAAALQAGKAQGKNFVVDSLHLANIHTDVLYALSGSIVPEARQALGIIETYSVAASILAADAAAKAADICLLNVYMAMGLGGKGYVLMSGDVAATQAGVNAGVNLVQGEGMLVNTCVIPSPDANLWKDIL